MLYHLKLLCRLLFGICAMRRFHQAIIATVAVLSLIGFLLYKHEYDRLNNLLHVLNTFGSTNNCNPSYAKDKKGISDIDVSGLWQQVENVYIYSAFYTSGVVQILGVIPSSISVKDLSLSRGTLWYDSLQSNQHCDLKLELVDPDATDVTQENWKIVSFTCKVKTNNGSPYAVSLLSSNEPEMDSQNDLLAMIRVQTLPPPFKNNVSVAVCAAIRTPLIDESLLQQFVKFHHHIGVNQFTFYDLGISPTAEFLLNLLRSETPDLDIQILRWNFPFEFGDVKTTPTKNFMSWDCITRHAYYDYVVFSSISYLIVPKFHSHLTNLFKDENAGNSAGGMRLFTHTFCAEFDDNPDTKTLGVSLLPMFLKTKWVDIGSNSNEDNDLIVIKPHAVKTFSSNCTPILKQGYNYQLINEEIAVAHSYKNCSKHSDAVVNYDDALVRRFLGQIKKIP